MLVVSAILLAGYAYVAARLTSTAPVRVALAAPFVMVWILPVVYWFGDRDHQGRLPLVGWVTVLSWQREPEVARRQGEVWRLVGFQD